MAPKYEKETVSLPRHPISERDMNSPAHKFIERRLKEIASEYSQLAKSYPKYRKRGSCELLGETEGRLAGLISERDSLEHIQLFIRV